MRTGCPPPGAIPSHPAWPSALPPAWQASRRPGDRHTSPFSPPRERVVWPEAKPGGGPMERHARCAHQTDATTAPLQADPISRFPPWFLSPPHPAEPSAQPASPAKGRGGLDSCFRRNDTSWGPLHPASLSVGRPLDGQGIGTLVPYPHRGRGVSRKWYANPTYRASGWQESRESVRGTILLQPGRTFCRYRNSSRVS